MTTPERSLIAVTFGSVLSGGGLLHMWFHAQWGQEDWGVVAIIVLGAGIIFHREVKSLLLALKGIRAP